MRGILNKKCDYAECSIENFKKVIYIDPSHYISFFYIGNLYQRTKQLKEAKKAYENCLDIINLKENNEIAPFCDGLTVHVLKQTVQSALEAIK